MRSFLALLYDSVRQTIDQKILFVLLALSAAVILCSLSLSFEQQPIDEIVGNLTKGLERTELRIGTTRMRATAGGPVDATVSDIAGPDEGRRYTFALAIEDRAILAAALEARRRFKHDHDPTRRRMPKKKRVAYEEREAKDIDDVELTAYLHDVFRARGAVGAIVSASPPVAGDAQEMRRFRVSFDREGLFHIDGAHEYSLFFGAVRLPIESSLPVTLMSIFSGAMGLFAGFIGMIIAVIVTAGFIPRMLRKGHIDFLLSRPIGRGRLLVAKFVGGLVFFSLVASLLIGGMWFALGLRSGYWTPWPLATIATLIYFFATLYAFEVCIGVLTRSTVAVIFLSLLFWGACSVIGNVHRASEMGAFGPDVPAAVTQSIDAIHTVMPRTGDLDALNSWILARAYLSKDVVDANLPAVLRSTNYVQSLSVTAIWIALLLFLAWLAFRRRDF